MKTTIECDCCGEKIIIAEGNVEEILKESNWEIDGVDYFCPECNSRRKEFICTNCGEEHILYTDDENEVPENWIVENFNYYCSEDCQDEYYEDNTPEWQKKQDIEDLKANLEN